MKKYAVIFGLVSVSWIASAQAAEVGLPLDSLIQKLHDAVDVQKSIEVEEIKGVYKITPWHFVPSLNYDFINHNYYLTVSSGPFVTNMINKRQEKRRLSAVERQYANRVKTSEIRLKSLYVSVIQKLTDIQLSKEILSNDVEIFKIKQQQHANNEIDTESFLSEKSAILTKIKNHNRDVSDIQASLLEIEQLTEQEINFDLQQFYFSPNTLTP
jgi:hypothetical protein